MNEALSYLNRLSLKITLTVPLILNAVYLKMYFFVRLDFCEKEINNVLKRIYKMYKMHNRIKILFLKMNSAENVLG